MNGFSPSEEACGPPRTADTVRQGLESHHPAAATNGMRCLAWYRTGRKDVTAARKRRGQAQGGLMVLVDTSVWISLLPDAERYARRLERAASKKIVMRSRHEAGVREHTVGDRVAAFSCSRPTHG